MCELAKFVSWNEGLELFYTTRKQKHEYKDYMRLESEKLV